MAHQVGMGHLRSPRVSMICSAVIGVTGMSCTGTYMDTFTHNLHSCVLWARLGNLSARLDAH